MTEPLAVGVIGVGHLGSLHARMYSQLPDARLAGVYDIKADVAASVAKEFGMQACASLDDLLARVRAVSVAVPSASHASVAAAAVSRGIHVFVEKPMTKTVAEAEELVRAAAAAGVKIQVGHIERFNPALLALERYHLDPMFIESHRLAQFNPRGTDVAVVLDLMIHDIDIIMSLVRSPVKRIDASGIAVVSENIDIANARLQFENGCVANVTASRISQKKMRKMRMFQRDAYISVDFSDATAEVFRLVDPGDPSAAATMMLGEIQAGAKKRNIVYEQPEIRDVNALKVELQLFLDAVKNDSEPPVTGADGLAALKIADEIMRKIGQQNLSLSSPG